MYEMEVVSRMGEEELYRAFWMKGRKARDMKKSWGT
jgi:hypothetical protein